MKRLSYLIEYVVLCSVAVIFKALPLPLFYGLVRWLGHFAFDVVRIRRAVTMNNIRTALGDQYTEDELVHFARDAYSNIAVTFAEIAIYPRLKSRIKNIVDYSDFSALETAYDSGKGVIVVTCHYGSWEFLANALPAKGIPVTAVGKTQSNPYVDRFLGNRRKYMNIDVVARGAQIRQLVKKIHDGGAVLLASDQDAGKRGVHVPFFGKPASTPVGAAQLAIRYGLPIVVAVCERTENNTYTILTQNLPVQDDDTVETLTDRMNAALETFIRRHPEQYLWMHKRWKTKPEDISKPDVTASTLMVSAE